MGKLKSWRWSRLQEGSAYKRLLDSPDGFINVAFAAVIIWISLTMWESMPLFFGCLLVSAVVAAFFAVLQQIVAADDCFMANIGKIPCKVYVYKVNGQVKLLCQGKEYTREIIAADYEQEILDGTNSFVYFLAGLNKWYYVSAVSDEPVCLGRRFGKKQTVFLADDGTVNVLHNAGYLTFKSARIIESEVYLPPVVAEKIHEKGQLFRQPGVPDDYLIMQKDGEYSIWGIYLNRKSRLQPPVCVELIVPALIFKDAGNDVILTCSNEKYHELYRKQSHKRNVNDTLIELTDKYQMGGIVWRFNAQNSTLQKIYEGNFICINFDTGEVIGENGWTNE